MVVIVVVEMWLELNNKILLFPTSVLNILVVSRVVYVVTQVVRFTVQSLRVKTVDHISDQFTDQIARDVVMSSHTVVLYEIMPMVIHDVSRSYVSRDSIR